MTKSVYFILFFVVSCYGEPSFLDFLPKCSIKDSECLKEVAKTIMYNMTDYGIPEMGIGKLDPLHIRDITVSLNGLMDITMVDGYTEGMRNCKLEAFNTNIDTKITTYDIFCDVITIKGVYNVKSTPLIDFIFDGAFSGNGTGSILLQKMIMNFTSPYTVERLDGEIYLIPDFAKAEYDYEILDRVTFEADHLALGDLEIAPAVTKFMNRNWKPVMQSCGRFFSDKGMSISYQYATLFFKSVAAKKFILDDLSEHVSENLRCSLASKNEIK